MSGKNVRAVLVRNSPARVVQKYAQHAAFAATAILHLQHFQSVVRRHALGDSAHCFQI